jgi:hypothetical protein
MLQGRNWSKVCTACSTDNQLQTAQPISIFLYQEHFFGGLFAPSNTFSLYCDFFTIFTRCDKVTRCYKVVTGLKFVLHARHARHARQPTANCSTGFHFYQVRQGRTWSWNYKSPSSPSPSPTRFRILIFSHPISKIIPNFQNNTLFSKDNANFQNYI